MPEKPTEQDTNGSEDQSQPRIRPITGTYNRDLMMKDMGGWASDVPDYDPEKPIPLHPNDQDIAIASSGDPERDQRDLAQFRRSQCRLAEGLCPNGCGPIVDGDEPNSVRCPVCSYVRYTRTLYVGDSYDAS